MSGIPRTCGMQKPTPIRLLIASNKVEVRQKLASMAKKLPAMIVAVADVKNARAAVESCLACRPEVAIWDLQLSERRSFAAIRIIYDKIPATRLILLSSLSGDKWIDEGLPAAAKGFIRMDVTPQELADCIRCVNKGSSYTQSTQTTSSSSRVLGLTKREFEVLHLVAADMRNKEIGTSLSITEGTVKIHIHNILSKLGVNSRSGAIAKGLRRHLF
jgi:DNA-binding NarL/FixJ family response regulator